MKTNNASYSNINALKLHINVNGNWPVFDST